MKRREFVAALVQPGGSSSAVDSGAEAHGCVCAPGCPSLPALIVERTLTWLTGLASAWLVMR
jgi:hypothetical protein